jgi:hypothetical protein
LPFPLPLCKISLSSYRRRTPTYFCTREDPLSLPVVALQLRLHYNFFGQRMEVLFAIISLKF